MWLWVGDVLSHWINCKNCPIAFASTTLTPIEHRYSNLEREALAIMFGVKNFINIFIAENLL